MNNSKFHAFHWPDHVIGKRESRTIRQEHNMLFNSHDDLLTLAKKYHDMMPTPESERAIRNATM